MAVKRFRTRTVEVEAVQFNGVNHAELKEWTEGHWDEQYDENDDFGDPSPFRGSVYDELHGTWIKVSPGQWIVRGVKGEYYPCDDETFHWKYSDITNESGGILLKKETIFDLSMESGEMVYFITDDENIRVIIVTRQDWVDFGEPVQITVTIEPGDKLNDSTPKES